MQLKWESNTVVLILSEKPLRKPNALHAHKEQIESGFSCLLLFILTGIMPIKHSLP